MIGYRRVLVFFFSYAQVDTQREEIQERNKPFAEQCEMASSVTLLLCSLLLLGTLSAIQVYLNRDLYFWV